MDLTISGNEEYALLTETRTGRTALCVPSITGTVIAFKALAWFATYDDAFAVIAALEAMDMKISDVYDTGEETHEEPTTEKDEPVPITAAASG